MFVAMGIFLVDFSIPIAFLEIRERTLGRKIVSGGTSRRLSAGGFWPLATAWGEWHNRNLKSPLSPKRVFPGTLP
jgi:hypothetical protein